jgi:hypothetical protein
MDRDRMVEMAGEGPLNTDDDMIIEYSAPMNLHAETQEPNFELLLRYNQIPVQVLPPDPEAWRALARVYRSHDDYPRAIPSILRASSLLPDGDERKQTWIDKAAEWKKDADKEGDDDAPAPDPVPDPTPAAPADDGGAG